MSTLITHIKRIALALCLATPVVSRAVTVGDTVTWSNADGLTASDVVNANHCSFSLQLPAMPDLPDGSIVRITNVQIASINSQRVSNSTNNQNDPHSISIGNIRSSEVSFITSETLADKYIDSYDFSDVVEVEVGKKYDETWGNAYTAFSGYGITFLHSNGNRWSGGTTMNCTVGGTTSGAIANGTTVFPIYKITAEVVSVKQEVEVSADTTVSAINDLIGENATDVSVTVADDVTITFDTTLDTRITSVSSAGTVTLSAETQPDLSGVSFNVQGALLRSWLTPGVVGFNFDSTDGNDTSGALATGAWYDNASDKDGTSTAMFADGLSMLTWSSATCYRYSGTSILNGYLDDGSNGGNGAVVKLSNMPYETYDVIIYCSSDNNPGTFLAKTVNGKTYTWDSSTGAVVEGNSTWGKAALSIPVYGVNALRIKSLSGPLTIYGTARNGSNRGGIAAIQIMPPETPDNIRTYTLTLNGTATTWSAGNWTLEGNAVEAQTSGNVEIVATVSTELTIDAEVNLADLKVKGGEDVVVNVKAGENGSLFAIKTTIESGVFQQGSEAVLGATPTIVVEDGATFDLNGLAVSDSNAFSIEGDGAGVWPWALTSSGGEFATGTLCGFTLTGDATIGGENKIGCGKPNSASTLGFGTYKLTKTGAGELSFTNIRSAADSAGTFDITGGTVTLNEYTNLDGSNMDNNGRPWASTAVIIRSGASLQSNIGRWVWIGSLELDGGTITTTSNPFAIQTALTGAGSLDRAVFDDGTVATLSGDLTVTTALTLSGAMSFLKDSEAESDVVVDAQGSLTASGAITVGEGVTLNLGTNRPTVEISVAEGGTLAVKQQNASDVIALSVSAQPGSVVLYGANGDLVSNPRISFADGTLTIMPPLPTLEASGDIAFDTASSWVNSTMPEENGDAIIELVDDATITVSGTYAFGALTITGSGVVTFSGEGTITAGNISVKNGATFTRNANISAMTGISLDSGTVLKLDGVTESATISGAGAVETYGMVVLGNANTMTGGITVKPGSRLSASVPGAYGEYQSGWAYTEQRQVVVEDGGTVDINNIANSDSAVALTIAGKGVMTGDDYAGAVIYSGSGAVGSGSRQISSLVLAGDAMVDVGAGWGLVHSGWGNARLGLNGHTLTVRGLGTFPVVNANNASGAATTGTIVLDGATLELSNGASNLEGVNIVVDGCETINLATAPTALGSLTIKPSASGTTATNWNHPVELVPVVDVSNIDYANLVNDQELTLFTAPAETTLSASTINARINGRYTTTIEDNTVKATYHAGTPTNFLHYNFDEGVAVNTGKASDSGTQIYSVGEASDDTLVDSRNGKAVQVHTGYTPYWDSYVANLSPFHAGEVTVTTVAKMNETGVVLWGLGGAADNLAVGLVVEDANTAKVVAKRGTSTIETLATATVAEDLTSGWHFFAVVSDENGTTLYVDDNTPASSDTGILASIGQQGQLGSFHGGAFGANKVGADGYYLDDFRIYDAALTAEEVADIQDVANPKPLITIASTDNGTVSVVAGETPVASGDHIASGTTITVTIIPAEGYKDDEIAITMGGVDITETVAAAEGTFEVTDDVSITVTFVPDVVSFTVEAVANTTVKVMEGASEIVPDDSGAYTVGAGAYVQVIWEGAEGYSVTGGTTAWFTPSANQAVAAPTGMVVNEVAARIFDTTYATLKDAVDAATAYGAEVVLLKDVTLTERIEPNPGGSSMTINLNGHTITRTGTSGNGSAFDVKSGTVTIKNGTIDCTQDDTAIAKDGVYAITARAGSTVTLEGLNVTVNSECGACVYPFANNMGVIVQVATVYIKSGTYLNTTTTPYRYRPAWTGMSLNQANKTSTSAVNTGGIATQMIFVSGGTFGQVDPELGDDSWTEGEGTFIDGTASASYIAVPNGDGTYTVREGTWVAKVGDTKFESLDEAVAAAKVSGEQVMLLKDHPTGMAEPFVVSDPVTVNANGHLISTPTVTVADGYIIAPEQSFLGADTWIVETVEQEQFSRIVKYGYGATRTVKMDYLSGYGNVVVTTGDLVRRVPDYDAAAMGGPLGVYFYVMDGAEVKFTVTPYGDRRVKSATIKVGDGEATSVDAPVEGVYTVTVTGGNAVIGVVFEDIPSVQPIVPSEGGSATYDDADAATSAAEAINDDKATLITIPTTLTDEQKATYYSYVEAKATGTKVELGFTAAAEQALQTVVDAEAEDLAEAAAAAAASANGGAAEVATTPGLYYVVEAGSEVDGITPASCTLATGSTLDLTLPNKGTKGFYKIRVSVTPVQVQE